ncbi:MAG: SUMF1/EgtB/PvdO family nonheme iron enzyme [Verrucomicrobia bacterium]|nr:SUMF1/EgtB/PvdO family nonheme iron enzyme [Verrucomicrobiota bacterium]
MRAPQTEVVIASAFWMGRFEVTQSEFERIVGQNPSRFRGPHLPVDSVTWHEAMQFAELLTAREREAGRLPPGFVYRLPTEAEWEFAARAGTSTPFSFGNLANPGMAIFKEPIPRRALAIQPPERALPRRLKWAASRRMRGDYTICMATSVSGF